MIDTKQAGRGSTRQRSVVFDTLVTQIFLAKLAFKTGCSEHLLDDPFDSCSADRAVKALVALHHGSGAIQAVAFVCPIEFSTFNLLY